jgi:hypothetical protein
MEREIGESREPALIAHFIWKDENNSQWRHRSLGNIPAEARLAAPHVTTAAREQLQRGISTSLNQTWLQMSEIAEEANENFK